MTQLFYLFKVINLKNVFKKDFDVLGPQILMSFCRSSFFDFAGVADEENSAYLTPALTEESPVTSTLKPFQPIV